MSCHVEIDGIICFAPNIGIWIVDVEKAVFNPEHLAAVIKIADHHIQDEILVEACCGAAGPLYRAGKILFPEFLSLSREYERTRMIENATYEVKKAATKERRTEFQRERSRLLLQMIEAGHQYVCAEIGCDQIENLHIDHVVPLSRGGSDDLSNLQFLCASHNCKKGDRV